VSGVIEQISCDYNTKVFKGQLCAKIDPRPYQSIVNQDQANLEAAQAQLEKDQTSLEYAQLTEERNQNLGRRGLVPQDTVDSSKSVADQARAQVDFDRTTIAQHRAALEAAEINLGYTNIVSPVDGIVVSRNVTTGQTVAASFQTPTLFLIANDLTKMQVDANVSESDIGGVQPGDGASFTVDAFPDHTFTGDVTQVRQAPQTVQNVVTYDVVVSVSNPELMLKPGMTATARIVVTERDAVTRVPEVALRFVPGGAVGATESSTPRRPPETSTSAVSQAHSWLLRGSRAVQVPVTIGLEGNSFAEVTAGDVRTGDRVIVSEGNGAETPDARPNAPRFRL
jgi:HlyD family secretion protein